MEIPQSISVTGCQWLGFAAQIFCALKLTTIFTPSRTYTRLQGTHDIESGTSLLHTYL